MGLSSSRSSCVVLAVALASCGGEPRPAEGPRPPRPPGPPALAADDRPIATVSVATLDRTSGPVRRDAALPVEATVLVVSATGQEPELAAIRSMLLYRGVPHEVFVATAESPLTADRLRTGGHGRYQATILTSSSLADGEQSALSAAEWAVLAEYEQTFAVRRAVLAAWPDPALGFAAFTTQDTSASPLAVNCTAAGAAVFRDVACTISQQIAADPAYLATPAAGAPLTPLVTDAAGHALAAIHRGVDGREALLLMTRQHPAHLHTLVFLHGVLGWVTGGTYLGERRIELSVQLDDLFLPTPTWAGGVYRLSAADLRAARAWQAGRRRHPSTPELRLSWAFNGEGTAAGDPLTIEARDHSREWHWMNHTLNHHDLDALRYADAYTQLAANIVIAGNLRLAGFDREAFVGPAYSGLVNPESLRAAHDLGVRYMFMDTSQVGCDSSPNTGFYNTYRPDILLVPRRPTNLYYNASTPTQWVDEYNSIYRAHWGRDLTYAEVLEQESETLVRYLLRGEADPWMFHQANLRAYDGVRSLLGDLLDVTLTKLEARLKVPVATPPASDIGRRFARRLDYDAAGVRATLFRGRALVIDAARPVSVPITGGRAADGEAYGGDVVRLVTVQPGTSTCVPLDDEGRGCDPAPVRAGGPGPTSALPIGVCDNGGTAVYAPAAGGVSVTPVPRGSSWRYWDRGGLDGAWRKPGFVDASWSTGPGPLGYGERYHATTVSYGASPTSKPITTYFRRSFTIASVDAVIALRGEVMFDDGFVVYLNGIEIERSAMGGAPVSATTLSTVYETGNEYLSFDWTAHRRRLVTGTNTIAIEVHQASSDSNDVTFDLALLAEVKAPPVGAGVAPVGAGVTPVGAGVATDAGVPVTPR